MWLEQKRCSCHIVYLETIDKCTCTLAQCIFNLAYCFIKGVNIIIPSQQHWRGYSNATVRVWYGEWVCLSVHQALPCGHNTSYNFCLITFTYLNCSWWEEEPYRLWVTWSKVEVKFGTLSINPCGHNRLQWMPYHVQTLHVGCSWWEEELYWFRVMRSKVKV